MARVRPCFAGNAVRGRLQIARLASAIWQEGGRLFVGLYSGADLAERKEKKKQALMVTSTEMMRFLFDRRREPISSQIAATMPGAFEVE